MVISQNTFVAIFLVCRDNNNSFGLMIYFLGTLVLTLHNDDVLFFKLRIDSKIFEYLFYELFLEPSVYL